MGKGQEAADTLLGIEKKNSSLCESSALDKDPMEPLFSPSLEILKN